MKISSIVALSIGKSVQTLSRLAGRGGSALPGLVIEKLIPGFLNNELSQLPDGVIVVTGTNGKTTTTKIISELLISQGKRVLTNKTGSNFTRGIVSEIAGSYPLVSAKPPFDVAVIELDEAYANLFVKKYKPDYVVALNVMRDQLDRFGELDYTSKLIANVLKSATRGCVINADETEFSEVAASLSVPVSYYGADPALQKYYPTDAELLATGEVRRLVDSTKNVELKAFSGQNAEYRVSESTYKVKLKLRGPYSFHNAAAAIAAVKLLLPESDNAHLLAALENISPAFGRNEVVNVNGKIVELVLVKNPSSFRQALLTESEEALTMIAINDNYPDGRDVSWLWDVDFTIYKSPVLLTSGIRATDMALRLRYDEVEFRHIEPDLNRALQLLTSDTSKLPRRIFCTYTAMLGLRGIIKKSSPLRGDI